MSRIIRWGILGTGNIARQFARGLRDACGAELVAVGSRSVANARQFGRDFSVPRCHGTYSAVAADSDVDVVYVATPHPLHRDNTVMSLESGKAVLCEKPLTINAAQAEEVIALARTRNLFLMEAMWTRFLPPIARLREMLRTGVIGDARIVSADLGFDLKFDPCSRLYDPNLGGGCLLDVGVYPVSLAMMILGSPTGVSGEACIGSTGVDEQESIALSFEGGRIASLYASIRMETPKEARIVGTKGQIHLHSGWWKGGPVMVTSGQRSWMVDVPVVGNGYQYEADEVARCMRMGSVQSDTMPWSDSLAVMRTMDRLRALWSLKYPME